MFASRLPLMATIVASAALFGFVGALGLMGDPLLKHALLGPLGAGWMQAVGTVGVMIVTAWIALNQAHEALNRDIETRNHQLAMELDARANERAAAMALMKNVVEGLRSYHELLKGDQAHDILRHHAKDGDLFFKMEMDEVQEIPILWFRERTLTEQFIWFRENVQQYGQVAKALANCVETSRLAEFEELLELADKCKARVEVRFRQAEQTAARLAQKPVPRPNAAGQG